MEKVNIVLAGHTNVGKTTLTRNLIREKIGEIKDRANVTTKSETVTHHSIFANITDCPGFQEAGRILDIMDNAERFNILIGSLKKKDLNEDIEVLASIKNADVVYYICTIDTIPEKGNYSELELIKKFCSRIIGIINKKKLKDSEIERSRILQWKDFFNSQKIINLEYDFYWDSPNTITQLFQITSLLLDGSKKFEFEKSLDKYHSDALKDYEKVASSITDLIKKCVRIRYVIVSESAKEYDLKVMEIKEKIFTQTYEYIQLYLNILKNIYKLNYEVPEKTQLSLTQIENIIKSSFSKGVDTIASKAAWGAGAGAATLTISMLKAAVMTATLASGVGPLILLGLAAGGLAGGVAGSLYGAVSVGKLESTKKIEITFSEKDLFDISILGISTAWMSAYQGYGMSDIITFDRVEKLINEEILPLAENLKLSVNTNEDVDLKEFQVKLITLFEQIRL